MRVLAVVLAFGALAVQPALAQAPAPAEQATPAPPAPAPQTKTPPPAQQPAAESKTVQLPPPFQDGFKYGFVRMQLVASESAAGKKASAEITALRDKLGKQLTQKNDELMAMQKRLDTEGALLDDSKRQGLETDIMRLQRDIQRMAEDADQDVQRLEARLQQEFLGKLLPVIDQIAKEKKVDMVFDAERSGLLWAAMGMDLTTDVIRALDADGAKPAAAAPASNPPSAPASSTPK